MFKLASAVRYECSQEAGHEPADRALQPSVTKLRRLARLHVGSIHGVPSQCEFPRGFGGLFLTCLSFCSVRTLLGNQQPVLSGNANAIMRCCEHAITSCHLTWPHNPQLSAGPPLLCVKEHEVCLVLLNRCALATRHSRVVWERSGFCR